MTAPPPARNPARSSAWRRTRISQFFAALFVVSGIHIPFLGIYLRGLGFNYTAVGLFYLAIPVARTLGPPIWGPLADARGVRHHIVWVLGLGSLAAVVLLSTSRSVWVLAVALVLYGFFRAPLAPLADAAAMEELGGRDRGRYGRMRIFGSLGLIAGAFAAGAVMDFYGVFGFPHVFIAGAAVCAAGAFLLPPTRTGRPPSLSKAVRGLMGNRSFVFLVLGLFLARTAAGAYNAFFAITLRERGATHLEVALAWGVAIFAEILLFMAGPWLLRRFRARSLLLFSVATAVIRWAATGMVQTPLELLMLQPLHALTFGGLKLGAVAYVDEISPGTLRNSAQSLYTAGTFGLGGLVGYLVWGPVMDAANPHVAFLGAALIAGLGVLVLVFGTKDSPASRPVA